MMESFNTTLYSTVLYEDDEDPEDENEVFIDNGKKDSGEDKKIDPSDEIIKQVKSILSNKSLRKSEQASKIHDVFAKHVKFGDKWKIRSVKDDSDNVYVSLRQTYPSKRPFGNDSQITVSRMAFLSPEKDGIFIYDADHQDNWSKERKSMSNKILKLLKATPNEENPYLYTIGNSEEAKEQDKD